ncbi:MAG TPA: hypothetical protein VI300_19960, partial [Solirubrobacter sp.]
AAPPVVVRQGPAGAAPGCWTGGGAAVDPKLAVAATVAKDVRGSFATRKRPAIVFAAAAVSIADVRGNCTPEALTFGATANVSNVMRRPPSTAVTRGLEPSSSRGEPTDTVRCLVRNRSAPAVRSAFASPAASASVTLRPERDAPPEVRTVTPRAFNAASVRAVNVTFSEPVVAARAVAGTLSASATTAKTTRAAVTSRERRS